MALANQSSVELELELELDRARGLLDRWRLQPAARALKALVEETHHPIRAEARRLLGVTLIRQGRWEKALEVLIVAIMESDGDNAVLATIDHARALAVHEDDPTFAIELVEATVESLSEHSARSSDVFAYARAQLAALYLAAENHLAAHELACELVHEAGTTGCPVGIDARATAYEVLGEIAHREGDYEESAVCFFYATDLRDELHPGADPRAWVARQRGVIAARASGATLHQTDWFVGVAERTAKRLGKLNPLAIQSLRLEAVALDFLGQSEEALELHHLALRRARRARGPRHAEMVSFHRMVASAEHRRGDLSAALTHQRQAVRLQVEHEGLGHHRSFDALLRLADWCTEDKSLASEVLGKRAWRSVAQELESAARLLSEDDARRFIGLHGAGRLLWEEDHYAPACELLESAAAGLRIAAGELHPITQLASCDALTCRANRDTPQSVLDELRVLVMSGFEHIYEIGPQSIENAHALARMYERCQRYAESALVLQRIERTLVATGEAIGGPIPGLAERLAEVREQTDTALEAARIDRWAREHGHRILRWSTVDPDLRRARVDQWRTTLLEPDQRDAWWLRGHGALFATALGVSVGALVLLFTHGPSWTLGAALTLGIAGFLALVVRVFDPAEDPKAHARRMGLRKSKLGYMGWWWLGAASLVAFGIGRGLEVDVVTVATAAAAITCSMLSVRLAPQQRLAVHRDFIALDTEHER